MSRALRTWVQRYVDAVDRFRLLILGASALVVVAGILLALGLPLKSDLSSLLPPSQQSVKDLQVLSGRARTFGNVIIMIEAPTAAVREQAGAELVARLRAMDKRLIGSISVDEAAVPRYVWEHRYLFADLADLEAARDALKAKLTRARLDANPLFIDLDDEPPPADDGRLAELMKKIDDAEASATGSQLRISPDGRAQMVTLQTTFPSSNIPAGRTVMTQLRQLAAELGAKYPGLTTDFAGAVNISIYEHDSVIDGMATAALITVILVFGALFLYYKAFFPVGAVLWSLLVGVAATIAFTRMSVGHLNVMSAFLAAIVVGNGINTGLLVLSRYFEEVRGGTSPLEAIGPTLVGAFPGTLGAAATAAVAYGSLIVTDFRGFRHFGVIGAAGMILCWLAAYTVLPAGLALLARAKLVVARKPPRIGAAIGAVFPRKVGGIIVTGALVTSAAIFIAGAYIINDPFAKDWRELQSDGPKIRAQRAVDARMRARFDQKKFQGSSFQLAIAVTDRAQVKPVVELIRKLEAARAPGQELFKEVNSIDDLVPVDQEQKLRVLEELRHWLEDPGIAQLPADERAKYERMKPPATLRAIDESDIPMEIKWPFVEQDGSVGKLIFAKGSPRFQTWNVDDRVEFAGLVRAIEMPPGAIIGGEPLVIADIVAAMKHDAPKMVLFALFGSILGVWLVVGRKRHGIVTIVCGLSGVVVMIALCAIVGLPVHFLDLIALPITIGIGIDYAVNLSARDREDGERGPRYLLATTGGAVLLCSFTTTVGYGSLIVSSNGGIRAFGIAAILGEIACVVMALILAPAILAWLRARDS